MKRTQHQPWSVQVELTEGCNRLCPFCGLNGIRDAPGAYKFATHEVIEKTARGVAELCPRARVEFAMHGEPLMNPKAAELLRLFRSYVPAAQMQVTTNGRVWLRGAAKVVTQGKKPGFGAVDKTAAHMAKGMSSLFDAGLDFIILDTYEPERRLLQRAARRVPLVDDSIRVMDFYNECIPQGVSPWHNHGRKLQRTVIVMDDIGVRDGEHKSRTLANHAGHNPQLGSIPHPLAKRCTMPFREITVAWNGAVNLCCHDWAHEATLGNVLERTLAEIWHGPEFTAFRRMLNAKTREFGPCTRCDYNGGGRQGLLPDVGEYMPSDRKVIRQVLEDSK